MIYRTYKTRKGVEKRLAEVRAMHPDKDFRWFVDSNWRYYVALCRKGQIVARCA